MNSTKWPISASTAAREAIRRRRKTKDETNGKRDDMIECDGALVGVQVYSWFVRW